jgi:serine-type D-Ala-D-Ala carboxypeptidase/endopeptidase (penicillin-binding protein 4)
MSENTETATVDAAPAPAKRTRLIIAATAAATLVVGIAFGAGVLLNGSPTPEPTETAASRQAPGNPLGDAPLRTCSIGTLAQNAALGTLSAMVTNPATSETLLSIDGDEPVLTASTMKLATAAVAMNILGSGYRFTTTVVDGSADGSVVLVGGGDPTLSVGGNSVYPGAPSIRELARQTVIHYAEENPDAPEITNVIVDVSMFPTSDAWHSSWPESERTNGYHALVVPLMVDGDRANPAQATSTRSTDPVGKAVAAFLSGLESAGNTAESVSITYGSAPSGAAVLGEVKSKTVGTLIGQMLPYSDNTLAEQLIRVASVELGLGGTASSIQQTMVGGLGNIGVDASGSTFIDGSGLSEDNAVAPSVMTNLVTAIIDPAHKLDAIFAALPISGKTGTLSSRFQGDSAAAAGAVHAKTGWIIGGYTLAGTVDAADGTQLVFSIVTRGEVDDSAKAAIDLLVTGIYNCGNNLAAY